MKSNYRKYCFLLLIVLGFHYCAVGQSRHTHTSKYVGQYFYSINLYNKSDTVSGMGFFNVDSFTFVYMVKHDSDYLIPLFSGTWKADEESGDVTLTYNSGEVKRSKFEYYGKQIRLLIGSSIYYLNSY